MKVRTRFIRSVIEAAQSEEIELPWSRDARRGQILTGSAQVLRMPYAKLA